ncbi:MAG: endonuclease/exonuclease/phosphatase family protein [Planctomycetota bacterium]|nr:endonuclease/exonuclease/phosphatase family protein [Planctomycetota bacterium]
MIQSTLVSAMVFISAFFGQSLCFAQAQADLRVMSFNIRYGTANDGNDVWMNRRELVVQTIKTFTPDLLGTQETLPFQASYMNEQLPDYTYVGWSREENKDGEQCGIFVRSERFEIQETGQFWLSESPEEKFSKSWDSSLPRVVTWVRLTDRHANDLAFLFANTHFDHRGTEARRQSAILLRRRLSEMFPKLPIIVTGDFNCDQGSEPYQELLKENLLRDSYRTIHPNRGDDEGTFHGFGGKPGTARIDWILATETFKATTAEIDKTNADDRYPSDHFPVSAVFQWQE